jgi:hypothetical protein
VTGAAAYSEHCFDVHSRTLSPDDFDHCVAFDHVASRIDLRPPAARNARQEPRFQPQSLITRHVRAAERVAADPGLIEARLFEIRRLADTAATRLVPVQLSSAEPPPEAAAAAPLARTPGPACRPAEATASPAPGPATPSPARAGLPRTRGRHLLGAPLVLNLREVRGHVSRAR